MATKRMMARDRLLTKLNTGLGVPNREELRQKIRDPEVAPEEKMAAMFKLDNRSRDESKSRQTRRCQVCGRPRGVFRLYGLCRCCLREAARKGLVPGLRKASW